MDWYLTPIFWGLYMSKKNLEWDENSIQKKKTTNRSTQADQVTMESMHL